MSILVTGGTGTVGSEVVSRLLERGEKPRVLTSSPEKTDDMPDGVTPVVGDLADPATLPEVFDGVERFFLLTPLHEDEATLGANAVQAAKRAGARRAVFMSVHRVEEGAHIPHFQSKIEIAGELSRSGIPHTVVAPNNFYQNDLWFRAAIVEHGVYPQPIGSVGLHRVDVRDIADAVVTALLEDGHEGATYPLVGPDPWTGRGTAVAWAEALDRDVVYGGDDLDAWGEQAREMMPDWMVDDLKIMYAHFQEEGLRATEEEFALQAEVLDHEPRTFTAFVREMADRWS